MTQFHYRAVVMQTGQMKTGTMEAASQAAVLDQLRRSGLIALEAKAGTGEKKKSLPVRADASARKAMTKVLGELAVLMGAGLALDRALALQVEHAGSPAVRAGLMRLREQLKGGASLARAMRDEPALFTPMAAAMAEAGEASGKLDMTLARLAETMERAEALREAITSAMVYPVMLLCVASGVILIMLLFVIPQFEGVFADLGGKLPFATQMILSLSRFVRQYGVIMLAAVIGLAAAGRLWLAQAPVRKAMDRLFLRAPHLGSLIISSETARFARTLASLVGSGVPLVAALAIARRVVSNSHIGEALERAAEEVKEGSGLAKPLAASKIFPPLVLSFLRTGEETANLALMLERLADVLDREVRLKTQRLLAVATPAITVLMGITVAGIVVSIISAILGINDLAVQS